MGAAIVSDVCRAGEKLLYVSAPEIGDARAQVDYYLSLLPLAPGEELADRRERVSLVSVADSSFRWLSTKLVDQQSEESAEARERIRDFVRRERGVGSQVWFSCYEPSENIERLAAGLGVACDQASSRYIGLGTKATGRRLFASLGIEVPAGIEECRSVQGLASALAGLVRQGYRKFVLKLNCTEFDGGGLGNALVDLSDLIDLDAAGDLTAGIAARLEDAHPVDSKIDWPYFASLIGRCGVVAEELIEADELRSPSYQGVVDADGHVITISTHEQFLSGEGQIYAGCLFPAAEDYRSLIIDYGVKVGRRLAEIGVRGGDFGVDFVAVRAEGGGWQLLGCELNLRATATKHGFLMATSLLGALPDEAGRIFVDGAERVYHATDGIIDSRYLGLHPSQLIAAVRESGLGYDHDRKTGVVLHMMSAVTHFGKFGAVGIGEDQAQAAALISGLRDLADGLVRC
ncbi:MAG TPA: peptide ligase PGM1-related protein [Streptosporangiaceae bacterium]|nr:peptide ligase PGM1-related protein [Streptosporangiaceae bacterium]